ncbi:glycosyltransferase, NfrB-like protein [Deinococcus geothermalis DSM 11300]|uniref:Glycosyltransferase, NfrB-like protein n=1 Tax=Deinococcus geothermalis (strain DSM 11300 / CIP 105573 / AG-3a) TaxID=319795 RepID=Q1IXI4_DEIGD|nr:glycosyl transferase family protein [Deinococcus geothermalis]ABF46050.1 glycosyltransferase, NfrB-like protein [Deinococcus geothermalis DSM 11300]
MHLDPGTLALLLLTTLLLLLYLVVALDDLLLDLAYLLLRRRIHSWRLRPADLQQDHPSHLAVMIGAWQEAGVVTPMIESTLRLMHYPASRVEFFVGVYPNDLATLPEVQALAERFPNVHCVVNERPGPTSKSQNLNGVYAAIKAHEARTGKPFDVIAVHDAEDVIHPYTFQLYSTLLKRWKMVQLPVFALFPRGRAWGAGLRGLLRHLTGQIVTGSYADEFAEHHLRHLPAREALGLFLPSAGTGFAMRREVMALLEEDGQVLTEGALAEDYELALRLWRRGVRVHFHVQPLPRLDTQGKLGRDYVAVREYFPTEVQAAIRQKGRWTYGITLQTPHRLRGLRLNLRDRLTLWHDQKGKYTNLIHLLGYPLSLTLLLAPLFGFHLQSNSLTRDLLLGVLGVTGWRMLMRAGAVGRIYGLRQALIATLCLPGLPLRWLAGNVINTLATLRAWRLFLFPERGQKRGTARWDKTERKAYVPDEVLQAVRRRLGDQWLFTGALRERELARLLRVQRRAAARLGQLAVQQALVDEAQVRRSLAQTQGLMYLNLTPEMLDHRFLSAEQAQRLDVAILGKRGDRLLVASPHAVSPERCEALLRELRFCLRAPELPITVYATSRQSLRAAYRRPGLRTAAYHQLVRDERIPLDMLPYEFERLTRQYIAPYGAHPRHWAA